MTSQLMSIAAVERDCGLPKETLRVWERRYGFPSPLRDAHNERLYPADQVATLRTLRRLIEAGHRPGKVVGRSDLELSRLVGELGDQSGKVMRSETREVLARLQAHDAAGLREVLNGVVLRSGLGAFAAEIGPELAEAVGSAWSRGELEIHQEHLFTEQFTTVLRAAINNAQGAVLPRRRPLVLFSTLPQEPHALGLLMAEAVFTLEGCLAVSLGVQTPVAEIAAAAKAYNADILALSFSSAIPSHQALAGLNDLRALAPARIEIWAGGACPGLRAKSGVLVLRELSLISTAVADWRARALDAAD